MIELTSVLGMASLCMVLGVSGSLADGIGEKPYVLPGCVQKWERCLLLLVDNKVCGDVCLHVVQIM